MRAQTVAGAHRHGVIVIERAMLHTADEEVMLVHIYLDARRPSVEILEGLCAMLQNGGDGESGRGEKERTTVHASFSGHLCDRHGQTSSESPFQKLRSTCQSTLESKCVSCY